MRQARHLQVVDVVLVAERLVSTFVQHQGRADPSRLVEFGEFPAATHLPGEFDGVHDLGVTGAAAQVWAEPTANFFARHGRILVQHPLGAHDDAGNAEAALQSAGRHECPGQQVALLGRKTFQRGNGLARDGPGLDHAGKHDFPVHHHRAAAALAHGLAAVFGGDNVEFVAKKIQQHQLVVHFGRHGAAVERELNGTGGCGCDLHQLSIGALGPSLKYISCQARELSTHHSGMFLQQKFTKLLRCSGRLRVFSHLMGQPPAAMITSSISDIL